MVESKYASISQDGSIELPKCDIIVAVSVDITGDEVFEYDVGETTPEVAIAAAIIMYPLWEEISIRRKK